MVQPEKKPAIRVTVKRQEAKRVVIQTDYIRLDSFLKLCGAVMTGGHAKDAVQNATVYVNGEMCMQRGKKLRNGDEVRFEKQRYCVAVQGDNAP